MSGPLRVNEREMVFGAPPNEFAGGQAFWGFLAAVVLAVAAGMIFAAWGPGGLQGSGALLVGGFLLGGLALACGKVAQLAGLPTDLTFDLKERTYRLRRSGETEQGSVEEFDRVLLEEVVRAETQFWDVSLVWKQAHRRPYPLGSFKNVGRPITCEQSRQEALGLAQMVAQGLGLPLEDRTEPVPEPSGKLHESWVRAEAVFARWTRQPAPPPLTANGQPQTNREDAGLLRWTGGDLLSLGELHLREQGDVLLFWTRPSQRAWAVVFGVLGLAGFSMTTPVAHLLRSLGVPIRTLLHWEGEMTFPEAWHFPLACAAFGIGYLGLALRPGRQAVWDRTAGQLRHGRQVVDVGGVSAIAVREVRGDGSRWDVLALRPDERRVRIGFSGVERDAYDAAGRMASFLSVPVVTYQGGRGS